MKKLIFTLFILISGTMVFAGGGKFEQKMGETLGKYAASQSVEELRATANQFLMIAKAEKKEWLPYYYHANILVVMSFTNEGGIEEKDALLDEADASIQEMLEIAPKEAEVHALNAFYLIARLSVDPASRGQKYSMLSQMALGKAQAIDAQNPRVRYVKLSNDMGTAQFFGKDLAPYCAEANELLGSWDDFKAVSSLHPSWGKKQVEGLAASCESE